MEGSQTVYSVNVGINERYLDFRFSTIGTDNELNQGWPTVATLNTASPNAVTKLGDGEYRLDLEELSLINQNYGTESHYKELYVPIFVETQYNNGKAYTMEYTLHIIRLGGDNSLRAIGLQPTDPTKEQLYDNDETAVKLNGLPKDGTLNEDVAGFAKMDMEMENDIPVYKAYVDSTVTTLTVEAKATYITAMLSMGVGTAPAITESDIWHKTISVNLTNEVTRIQILVRAEEEQIDNDAVYYLDIYKVDDNAELEEVTSTHTDPKDTTNTLIPNKAEQNTVDKRVYDLYISTNEKDASGLLVSKLNLTAKAVKDAAQVDMVSQVNTAITAQGTGSATLELDNVRDGDKVKVTVTSSNAKITTPTVNDYTVIIHLVNLELELVQITSASGSKDITGSKSVQGNDIYYHDVVDPSTFNIDLFLRVADTQNAKITSVTTASAINLPAITTPGATYGAAGLTIDQLNDPIVFVVTVESFGRSAQYYVEVLRSNSDTGVEVFIHYVDNDGNEQREAATLDTNTGM